MRTLTRLLGCSFTLLGCFPLPSTPVDAGATVDAPPAPTDVAAADAPPIAIPFLLELSRDPVALSVAAVPDARGAIRFEVVTEVDLAQPPTLSVASSGTAAFTGVSVSASGSRRWQGTLAQPPDGMLTVHVEGRTADGRLVERYGRLVMVALDRTRMTSVSSADGSMQVRVDRMGAPEGTFVVVSYAMVTPPPSAEGTLLEGPYTVSSSSPLGRDALIEVFTDAPDEPVVPVSGRFRLMTLDEGTQRWRAVDAARSVQTAHGLGTGVRRTQLGSFALVGGGL